MFKLPHNCSHLTHQKVMLKILHARLQWYVNHEIPDVQAGFKKAGEPEIKLPTLVGSLKMQEFQKNIYFCFIDYAKAFDCVGHKKTVENSLRMVIPDYLTCFLRNLYAGQEATVRTGHGTTRLVPNRKRSMLRLYIVTLLI